MASNICSSTIPNYKTPIIMFKNSYIEKSGFKPANSKRIKVRAIVNFFVGSRKVLVIKEGDSFEVDINQDTSNFWIELPEGALFGETHINDGWEIIP